MAGRMSPSHSPSNTLTPAVCVTPASAGSGVSNGTGVDLATKRGAYFVLASGALTGTATVAAHLQESDDNSNFSNVNTTTYPEATLAASNTANGVREMHYAAGGGRKRYIRAVVTRANNTALASCVAVTY